ncbi:MAG: hypothetical protein AB7E45_05700 [Candidatus Caldatribacteriota bacterium]
MAIKMENQKKKVNRVKPRKLSLRSLLLVFSVILVIFFINGCARWPEGPGGLEQKLLVIRVDINGNGKINTEDGNYYIVFDTKEDTQSPPPEDIDDWEEGYYYIKLDNYGFCFGQWDSPCQYTSVGLKGEKYFQINLDLDDLGNPEKIFMNVITTDKEEETYDYIDNPSELTIDTSWTNYNDYNKIEQDFLSDFAGSPDFDIIKVTTYLIVS